MLARVRPLFLILLAAMLFLAACGDSSSSSTSQAGNETASDNTVRVKSNEAMASAPLVPAADAVQGPAARGATAPNADAQAHCLTDEEGKLARLVNEYRASLGLPAVQISKSLSLTARMHSWDITNNRGQWPAPPPGKSCNLHSWSKNVNPALKEGTWKEICFTGPPDWDGNDDAHKQASLVAGFPGESYENSFGSSGAATAEGALTAWKNSPGHNGLITQQNGWGPMTSMGVGIVDGSANLHMSTTLDPAGDAQLCSGGNPMAPPPTAVPPTAVPPTAVPPTAVPPTEVPPTEVPPTTAAATAEPTTAAATAVPPTDVPPTDVPPTAVPPTAVPPTTAAPTGEILNQNGTIAAGGQNQHVFNVAPERAYTVVVTPSAEFDVDPRYNCTTDAGSASGGFDWSWEGIAETFTYDSRGTGTCTIDVLGYAGSIGDYTIVVTAR